MTATCKAAKNFKNKGNSSKKNTRQQKVNRDDWTDKYCEWCILIKDYKFLHSRDFYGEGEGIPSWCVGQQCLVGGKKTVRVRENSK